MNPQRIISSIGVGAAAVLLGLGIQYAVAQTWNAAPSSPPSNNVPAPINVGSGSQIKLGGLSVLGQGVASGSSTLDVEGVGYIRGLVLGSNNGSALQILDGNQGTDKVLTSDANGNARWSALGGGSSGTCNETPTAVVPSTTYHNTTGTKLAVVVSGNAVDAYISASPSFVAPVVSSTDGNSFTFIVPPGYYYSLDGVQPGNQITASAWQICEGSGGSGVTQITPGNNVTISPSNGTGNVTVNASSAGTIVGSCYYSKGYPHTGTGTCSCPTGSTKLVIDDNAPGGTGVPDDFLCVSSN